MKKKLKAIIELISVASSVFASSRETLAEIEKLDLSSEQRAILDRAKGPLAKCRTKFKEAVKDVFGTIARIGR
jgi:hypothetical protein